jgi:hypothetical protein
LPLVVVVHAANIQDRDGARSALEKMKGRFSRLKLIWADGTFECARQVKALSCGELDKVTILNGLVQKLLAGVK